MRRPRPGGPRYGLKTVGDVLACHPLHPCSHARASCLQRTHIHRTHTHARANALVSHTHRLLPATFICVHAHTRTRTHSYHTHTVICVHTHTRTRTYPHAHALTYTHAHYPFLQLVAWAPWVAPPLASAAVTLTSMTLRSAQATRASAGGYPCVLALWPFSHRFVFGVRAHRLATHAHQHAQNTHPNDTR